jgi:hypothetical protein
MAECAIRNLHKNKLHKTGAVVTWTIRASGTEPSGSNPFDALSAVRIAAIEAA